MRIRVGLTPQQLEGEIETAWVEAENRCETIPFGEARMVCRRTVRRMREDLLAIARMWARGGVKTGGRR